MERLILPLWSFILAGLVLSACSVGTFDTGTRAEQGTRAGILHVGSDAEPEDLDPHIVTGFTEHRIISALFEGLVQLDPENLHPVPGAAESWTISEDEKTYTFKIRQNARWSNGDPLTAHDFVYSWRRILSPGLASEYAYMLYCICNARAFNEGAMADFGQVGVKAPDDYTLEVQLEYPTPYFLSMQIHFSWFPVHRPTIETFGTIDERGTKWTRAGNLVGNGPFTLETWQPHKVIEVVKSPHYWDAASVRLNGINFYPIDNMLTQERAFRSGDLHTTPDMPFYKVQVYLRDDPERIRIHPLFGTYFYRFNITRPPLDDVRVRRALAMVIDREALCKNVLKAGQQPAGFLTPPGVSGYVCSSIIEYDIEEARRLLAEAGYPNGEGFPSVELLYNTSENHKIIAEAIQQMWKKHLGISITLTNQDWKVYLATTSNLDYDICRAGWYGDFLDPINFLECFVTDGGNNRTGWSSLRYDALLAEARHTLDRERRLELYQEAERILLEGAPVIPIYFYVRNLLMSPDVKGWHPNLLAYVPYKYLYLEPAAA